MGLAEELLSHVTPSHGLWRHEELVEIGHTPSGLKSWSEKYSSQKTGLELQRTAKPVFCSPVCSL